MKTVILLLLILLIIVPQEIINQDKLTNKLADLDARLGAMESARQPYVGDWYSFNVATISYSSASRINITDTTIASQLKIGDKIKITQTTDKYFYIVNVNSTSIDVFAGDDYSVANAVITYFGFSRLATPSGHPILFNKAFTTTEIVGDGCTVNNLISPTQKIYMIGNIVFVYVGVGFDIPAKTTGAGIFLKYPIQRSASGSYNYIQPRTTGTLRVTTALELHSIYEASGYDSGNSIYIQRDVANFIVSVYSFYAFYQYGINNQ